ncbi:hypothetical protein [Stenotrophomonas terrae]|uniref:hypothetical protein n=1 Tax=Stenotrophomonas terrae TaxID=405446 RepID=UPI000ADC43E7|nr:hypothetical protein [Stenotrophomonas terrae]
MAALWCGSGVSREADGVRNLGAHALMLCLLRGLRRSYKESRQGLRGINLVRVYVVYELLALIE